MMSEKARKAEVCDAKTASTLAAASIMHYYRERNWKIISFFPNAVCAGSKKCKKQN